MSIEKDECSGYVCMWCDHIHQKKPKNLFCKNCRTQSVNPNFLKIKKENFPDNRIYVLKISAKRTLENMRNGSIWFGSPKYFQQNFNDEIIGDTNECKYSFINALKNREALYKYSNVINSFFKNRYNIKFNNIAAKEFYLNPYIDYYRILCFYNCVTDSNDNIMEKFDNKLRTFGDYFSVILMDEFLKCLNEQLKFRNISWDYKNVVYLNEEKYSGPYNPRCKFNSYNYQNESRIVLFSDNFCEYNEMEHYKLIGLNNIQQYISKPMPIELLYKSKNINDWKIEFESQE